LTQLYFEGFIAGFSVTGSVNRKLLVVHLKYNLFGNPPFQKITMFFSKTAPVYVGFR